MDKMKKSGQPRVGDVVEISGHKLGQVARTGAILEVIGEPGREHFRVRWEDGHESVVFPSSDTIVRPRRASARSRA